MINAIVGTFASFLQGIFDFLLSLFPQERNTEYNADFLPASELMSRFNKGFHINGKSLSLLDSFKNLLVTGQTGSGKSSCILIPSCLTMRKHVSMCINDPSGELAKAVSGTLHNSGHNVIIINYEKPEMGGFNPLHRIKNKSDIQRTAELIIFTSLGKGGKDPFWNFSASSGLAIFIEIACSLPKENCHMYQVVQLINVFSFNPSKIDPLVVKASANNSSLLMEYKAFISNDPKVLKNIIVTIKSAIQIFTNPSVALTTSYDTVNFENCRKNLTTIFFNNSVISQRYYAPITSLFFQQFFEEVLTRIPENNELPIMFLLDEASSLYISDLPIVCANIRKARCGLMAIFQSFSQIRSLYNNDNAKSIQENCFTNVLLPGVPIDVAKEISATLGSFQYEDETGKHTRLLLTPDEVHQLDDALILCGNRKAIKLPMKPFYENFRMRSLTSAPPCLPKNNLPFTTPPLLQLLDK
ncbi:MAG: type IV secretory system conjugative DNA transfer family protein [Chitinophagaceae bacterium]|nr:type IV secretory system conjugative DNA transfer family protein [Chitinophagaceae bacterium]